MYACTSIHTYIHAYVHAFIHTYTHIHTHTHTYHKATLWVIGVWGGGWRGRHISLCLSLSLPPPSLSLSLFLYFSLSFSLIPKDNKKGPPNKKYGLFGAAGSLYKPHGPKTAQNPPINISPHRLVIMRSSSYHHHIIIISPSNTNEY